MENNVALLCRALLGLLFVAVAGAGTALQTDWRPIPNPIFRTPLALYNVLDNKETCILYKVNLTQQQYFQYVQYKTDFPNVLQFTVCLWSKFGNHSTDHPLFSYAVPDQPHAILAWVSNTGRSSYFNLAVGGHHLYNINFALRLNRWYHSCQSWNGFTGEWLLYVNGVRAGRGFAPELVGHVIPGGGVSITGQEQRQYNGGFKDGMQGEVTLLHLFGAALGHDGDHEVQHVMKTCSAVTDPFPVTSIISWRTTPKKLYSGALYLHARPICRRF